MRHTVNVSVAISGDLPHDARLIALVAPCGTGKTKSLHRWLAEIAEINKSDPLTAVFVTHRRTLSLKAVETLPRLNERAWVSH
jgi:hypothetical protein